MQVFVPHDTFAESVRVLDNRRLGKQRVETYQIMLVLLELGPVKDDITTFVHRPPRGWRSHPAVLAWQHNLGALMEYQEATCDEWATRGFNDTCRVKTRNAFNFRMGLDRSADKPGWWGDDRVHASHRGALLYKDPEWYSQWGWTEEPAYAYVWPHELQEV